MFISREIADQADLTVVKCDIDNARIFQKIAKSNKKQYIEYAEGTAFLYENVSGRNRICRLGLQEEVTDDFLDRTEDLFRANNSPCRVIINPYGAENVAWKITKRGYYLIAFMQVMVIDLEKGIKSISPANAIQIRRQEKGEELTWASYMGKGFESFGIPYLAKPEMHIAAPNLENSICYFAEKENKIAGVASVIFQDEWAYLFTASTIEEYRSNGIQTALINKRLLDAKSYGCKYAVIVVKGGSQSMRNAEKNGFQVAYTRSFFQLDFPGVKAEDVC